MSGNNPLVSIIIPAYNRAHLIAETLDSIVLQTYRHWECIVVDDGSTDDTIAVIASFVKKDSRIKLLIRPNKTFKGANTCRNIGLQNAIGDYIVFFDSDDLMKTEHLKVKLAAVIKNDYDFVIAQTRFFNNELANEALEQQYNYTSQDISSFNYISHKINWLTCDVLVKSKLAKSIIFNEYLSSGQEYNYFCKLIVKSTKGVFLNDVLSGYRFHENSIRGELRKNRIEQNLGYLNVYWFTYLEIVNLACRTSRKFLMYRCYRLLLKLPKNEKIHVGKISCALFREFRFKALYYIINILIT